MKSGLKDVIKPESDDVATIAAMKSGLKAEQSSYPLCPTDYVATIAAMKSGLKAILELYLQRIQVATIAAMKSGLKVLNKPPVNITIFGSNHCRDEKRTERSKGAPWHSFSAR